MTVTQNMPFFSSSPVMGAQRSEYMQHCTTLAPLALQILMFSATSFIWDLGTRLSCVLCYGCAKVNAVSV